MKTILITGANSYIGTSFEKWMHQWPEQYSIDTIDMIGNSWKEKDLTGYDVVLHVAGIAHISADPEMKSLYYKINRDLAIETAVKAKTDGVKQFIFMSSIIIYGDDSKIGEKNVITKDTEPDPSNFYGRSKLEADLFIQNMSSDTFYPVIVRTPMVYGKGCKGNFQKLCTLAKWCFIFPDIDNQRSMIFIDNLCEFIKYTIDKNKSGVFFPQNKEYTATKDIVIKVRLMNGKKTHLTKLFNPTLKMLSQRVGYINKVFGNKTYDISLSATDKYEAVDFEDSIYRIVK